MRLINTRSDLDAIAGTPEHDAFINVLKGSIYRLEKDDTAQQWVLVTDTTTIEKYGFTVADFTDLTPPDVPVYVADPVAVPQSVSMRSARLALLQAGVLSTINTTIASMPGVEGDAARIEWEYAQEVRRDSALVLSLIPLLNMTDSEIDGLFILAGSL
jgi:hypothetical protein